MLKGGTAEGTKNCTYQDCRYYGVWSSAELQPELASIQYAFKYQSGVDLVTGGGTLGICAPYTAAQLRGAIELDLKFQNPSSRGIRGMFVGVLDYKKASDLQITDGQVAELAHQSNPSYGCVFVELA